MNGTFIQFAKKCIELFDDEKLKCCLVDNLKKQYEMFDAEKHAERLLNSRFAFNRIKRKQLMPHHFNYFSEGKNIHDVGYDDFTFNMGLFNRFGLDVSTNNIYVIEGVCTTPITGINIKNINFYVDDELMNTVAGYQIDKLYYFESPFLVLPDQKLIISVELSCECKNFPILFIGYKFIGL